MVQSSKTGPDAAEIEAQMKVIRDDIAELTKLMKEAGDTKLGGLSDSVKAEVENLVAKSREKIDGIEKQVRQQASSIEDYVVEKPLQSAFFALLIGLFIGSIYRR